MTSTAAIPSSSVGQQGQKRAGASASGWREWLRPLASLRLTVVLLVLSMVLVFAGTWAQVDEGIWQVQRKYFHSLWTWVDFALFLPRPGVGQRAVPGGFPMPGGYLIGVMLLVNLLAAYLVKFRLTLRDWLLVPAMGVSLGLAWLMPPSDAAYWRYAVFAVLVLLPLLAVVVPFHKKRAGVILIHLGIVMLLVGEGITSGLAHEGQMFLDEGAVVPFTQDLREVELAVTDVSPADHDLATLVPVKLLEKGGEISGGAMPFKVRVDEYYPNSQILGPMQQAAAHAKPRANRGDATKIAVVGQAKFSGTEAQNVDLPSAYVTLIGRGGEELGTWLVSTFFDAPQAFEYEGRPFTLQLRFKREYKSYTMQLLRFAHDKYTGTDVAKNFASRIRLVDPTRGVDREVLIRMNEPLRYAGETFYQSSFKPGDKTSILQVVRNPGWLMPYVACTVGAAGLVGHFGITLVGFLRKRRKSGGVVAPALGTGPGRGVEWGSAAFIVPVLVVVSCGMYVLSKTHTALPRGEYDLDTFSQLPLSYEGRTLPMDSLARNSLKVIAGRERIEVDGKKKEPVEWLLDVMARPEKATEYPVIRIDNHDLLNLLQLDPAQKRYSFSAVVAHGKELQREITRAQGVPAKNRDAFDRKVLELGEAARLYMKLAQLESLYVVPPAKAGEDWRPLGDSMMEAQKSGAGQFDPAVERFVRMLQGYHEQQAESFNADMAAYKAVLTSRVPTAVDKAGFETWFNRFDPFMQCMVLYVGVFILAAGSWVGWTRVLARSAVALLVLTLVIHTIGLGMRIYISGRPPVTNLASSAIFIAWGGVVMAAVLELLYRNGVGAVAAAAMGFASLLISDRLAMEGDTMKVLQAVLDTNFWLATHVVCITLGYAATFLAGLLAVIYVVRGVLTTSVTKEDTKSSARMVYGIVCFAMLFSFVGTVLGGIWADQSWGRFWGWDPKENGAVLIVLWNAAILHARWGGLVKDRGVMLMAIFGNVVTAWSWFGTNMLGVGLHSYGFMESAMYWLVAFVISQLALIAVGNLPLRWWRSFGSEAAGA